MRAAYVDRYPNATRAILMAVMDAQMWCDKPENKQEMAEIVGRRQWFNVPVADIIGRIRGDIDYGNSRIAKGTKLQMKFWAGGVSYPYRSHDLWFLTENIRWGKFEPTLDTNALLAKVNREDLWRDAAKALSVAAADIPASPSRGKETFFDGKVFDPDNPAAYLKSLRITRAQA
jgi:nitrate/nitrite transport system substrate-binding protein